MMGQYSKAIGAAVGGILGVAVAFGIIDEEGASQVRGAIEALVLVLAPVIVTYAFPANAPTKP